MRIRQRAYSAVMIAIALSGVVACGGAPASPMIVSARANIFGAGHDVAPDPGRGGPGVLPPEWRLPAGAGRVLTFPSVTGSVNPIEGEAGFVSAAGDQGRYGTTNVRSFGGISGIIASDNGMFLVGVLLADGPPAEPAPARLDVTGRIPSAEIAPEIGQTFPIGDGRDTRIRVPDPATRLFLGFADGFLYRGEPGWYDNNEGELSVTVAVATG